MIDISDAIDAVAEAFVALHEERAHVFPVAHGHGKQTGSTFSMKSGMIEGMGAVGLKVGSYWPENRERGLPAHGSVVLLLNPETGRPRALVETSYLNSLRTAAANAVAAKCLAREDAHELGVVGAGHQAYWEIQALRHVCPVKVVKIWNRDPAHAELLVERLQTEADLDVRRVSLRTAVASDLVVTVTAARDPVVDPDWLRPGTYVAAMGADQAGKREFARPYPTGVRLFADMESQSRRIGEFQNLKLPIISIGAVLAGDECGRRHRDEITIFDSSGLAIQDLAIVSRVLAALSS